MNSATFDNLTRRTVSAVSRRSSILALGGAAISAAVPTAAIAGKGGKKAKKKCKKQVGKCKGAVREFCAGFGMGEQGCLNALLPCCQPLKKCNSANYTRCLIERFTENGF